MYIIFFTPIDAPFFPLHCLRFYIHGKSWALFIPFLPLYALYGFDIILFLLLNCIAILYDRYISQTQFLLDNTAYGDSEDQVGVSRLVSNGTFTSGYILHDVSHISHTHTSHLSHILYSHTHLTHHTHTHTHITHI